MSDHPMLGGAPDEFQVGSGIDSAGGLVPTVRFRCGADWYSFEFSEVGVLRFAVELADWLRPVAARHGLIADPES